MINLFSIQKGKAFPLFHWKPLDNENKSQIGMWWWIICGEWPGIVKGIIWLVERFAVRPIKDGI